MIDKDNLPLVSCAMPTANRRRFVPQAIDQFLRQDYPHKELVILDDGEESVADLIPDDSQIRYLRHQPGMTLGAKRNACVEQCRGGLIMHWDDDDWMAAHRISYQVEELLRAGAEVCSLRRMLWFDLSTGQTWLYQYPENQRPWLAGNSLLYTRAFWQRSPFPNVQVGSDTYFIYNQSLEKSVALSDYTFYVGMIHPKNTSPKPFHPSYWSKWQGDIHSIMGNDLDFYKTKANGRRSDTQRVNYTKGNNNGRTEDVIREQSETKNISQASTSKAVNADNSNLLVSVCLLSYKRPQHLQRIVDSLHSYQFVDEILVWNNNSGVKLPLLGDKVRVIESDQNMMCYGRFLCAKEARNNVIYVQDDDAIIKNVPELYHSFLADNSRITHALSPQHFAQRDRTHYADSHLALLGWGAFFQKEWLRVLDDYLAIDGDSQLFRREADKFFSLLLAQSHNTLRADMQLLDYHATPGIALYLQEEHQLMVALAVRRSLALLRESKGVRFPVAWNVVITCRNYGKYLREAVQSVLFNDADYIITIVDDASSDNTEQISREFCDKYPWISYIRHEQTVGTGRARNSGVAAADSIFVVLLDADDKISPHYLFEAEKIFGSGCDVVNPDAILFGQTNTRWTVPATVTLPMLLQKNPVHCCSAFRRSYWAQVGGVDETMGGWEDYEFWIRLAAAGARIQRIPGDHFYYRKHGTSRSTMSARIEADLQSEIRRKHRKLYSNQ
ncbi:MAG: glycosyltransferase [Pyrinomonadaceae bacterium]